jgi:type II secretory pathway pseudopilin PulG
MSKGVSQIATSAIYVGVTVSAISVALTAGVPALENMQDAASIRQAQQFMQQLDSNVQTVVSEGEGSTRTVSGEFDRGRMYFDNGTDTLIYELETGADVISPQTATRDGNIILSSSADVTVNETSVDGTDCYMMENEHIRACIKSIGSESNYKNISTSDLLTLYEFKDNDRKLDANLSVELNEKETTSHGTGYTTAETGNFIGTGEVRATISSEYGFTYDVVFRLPTGADFIQVDVQNYR